MLSGSWPGELFWFRGSADGKFSAPEMIKDKDGNYINIGGGISEQPDGSIMITGHGEFEESDDGWIVKYHGKTMKSTAEKPISITGTASATHAVDWDDDGDLDLLVGNIRGGVYLIPNDGSAKSFLFGKEKQLVAGGEPLSVDGDAGPFAADWDNDGDFDLLVGSDDGGVSLFVNNGSRKAPELSKAVKIVPNGEVKYGRDAPAEPCRGIRSKVCVVDWNGDGLLDLLVGDYASQKPALPEPTPEERELHKKLRKELDALSLKSGPLFSKLFGSKRVKDPEEHKKLSKQLNEISKKRQKLQEQLPPEYESHGWVWLFQQKRTVAKVNGRTSGNLAPRLDPAKTHAVIVGVLHWQKKGLTTYPTDNRKDRELYKTLAGMGVPKENMVLLLDEEGDLANIRKAIRQVAGGAREGDTFIFYYAGHGSPTSRGICFMNYDVGEKDSFAVSELADILKQDFKGERVLMFADCCFSGGLGHAAKQLSENGFKAASITSAAATNTSTNNWTFTHILVDILRGSRAADRNGDKVITITEATQEVGDAMKFREYQQHGQSRFNIAEDFRLCVANGSQSKANIPKPYELFEYVQVKENGGWKPARIVGLKNDKFVGEIQQYSTRRLVSVSKSDVRKFPEVTLGRRIPVVHEKPEKPLSDKEALAKAQVDGKYSELLKKIKVEHDYRSYSAFNDYGAYPATSYAGHNNLPTGYWVYVYPNWYIWEKEAK